MDEEKSKIKGEEQERAAMAALKAYQEKEGLKSIEVKEEEALALKQKKKQARERLPKLPAKIGRTMLRAYLKGGWKRNGELWEISGGKTYGVYAPKNSGDVSPCIVDKVRREITPISMRQFKMVISGAIAEIDRRFKFKLLEEFQSIEWFYNLTNTKELAEWLLNDDTFRIDTSGKSSHWCEDDEITAFGMRSDKAWTFHRLDFDLTDKPKPTPTYDLLFQNFANPDSLKAFIGSLFDPDSYKQQYVWMYGKGSDGKGSLVRSVGHVFGDAAGFCVGSPPADQNGRIDKFWSTRLIGKRFFVFSECNDKNFPRSPIFKAITGGDRIDAEYKGKNPFDFEPEVKNIFQSNERPNISNQYSDQRRIIYVECRASYTGAIDSAFEEKLYKESQDFVIKCYQKYLELCPKKGMPIAQNEENIEELVDDFESTVMNFIESNFEIYKDSKLPSSEFAGALSRYGGKVSRQRVELQLEKLGVVKCKKRLKDSENPRWIYLNLRKKDYPIC